jgi:diguanylate cyclase (GGDEF)-like protein/PAS domain S-box-containing protein
LKDKNTNLLSIKNRKSIGSKSLVRRLMLPFSILLFLSTIGAGLLLFQQHQDYLHASFQENITEFNHNMEVLLSEQASSLSLAIKPIANDPQVVKALRERDSDTLLMQWRDVFSKMKEENKLTHFYFLDKNRVCLLRVHSPSRRGDVIDRFTAQEAEWRRKTSSGLEVGPMGTLTLRVIFPVIVDNELIGYIELGKEIEDILQLLRFQSENHLAVVLRKEILNRSEWENGMRLVSREGDWDLLKNDVLSYTSFDKLSLSLKSVIQERLESEHTHQAIDEKVYADGNTYLVSMIGLNDVSGKEVGDLVVFYNATNAYVNFLDTTMMGVFIGSVMIGLVYVFIYILLRRSDEEMREQQRAMHENEQRLQQLARHSRSVVWEVDAQGMYTYVSDVAYEVLGYRNDEMVGKYFYDFHPLNGREAFQHAAMSLFEKHESFSNFKNRVESKEGLVVWMMTNGFPILSPDGRLLGYRGNDTDITAWQKAENSILESRNLLNTILDTIPIRVFWKSKTLRYLGCNTLFAQDAGLQSPQELIGKDDYQMTWAPQADLYREDDRAVMESGVKKLFYEEEQTTPEGETIWLSTSKVPFKNSAGEIIGIVGIYEDITKQKETQQKLLENAKMLNDAQRFARMGSWSLDFSDNHLVWSDEVYRIFEIDHEHFEVTYDAFIECIHPEDRDLVNNAFMTSLSSQQPYEVSHRLLMEDGRIKWVHESGMSEFDEAGKPLRSLGTVQDISERKNAEEEINRLAFFDTLTQLPNRKLLIDRLNQARVLSARNSQFGALLFIDLDNFKTLNDTLGHGIGDILLQQTAKRLMEYVYEGDSIARLGGDEFVVLLSGLGNEEKHAAASCEAIGKKILSQLNESYTLDGIAYQSTASMGITLFIGDTVSSDELMKQADLAMYKSKESGRNSLSFFDPNMESSLKERALLEEAIRRGIDEEQFVLYYQPQVHQDGRAYGVEALVRWNHPERGLVSPAEFIPIAEETGLIIPLGQWILKTAAHQIKHWGDQELFKELTIAVNVSVRQFSQNDFVEQVLEILAQSGADPFRLKIELTESLLVQNVEDIIEKMESLKAKGVRFSLDDFGTGYSSLSYLKRLPLDQLKIDQSFVRDVLKDPNDAILCKSTIALAESMGFSVIAEGVETKEQFEMLLSFGCFAHQGYWFSKPLPLDTFEAYHKSAI